MGVQLVGGEEKAGVAGSCPSPLPSAVRLLSVSRKNSHPHLMKPQSSSSSHHAVVMVTACPSSTSACPHVSHKKKKIQNNNNKGEDLMSSAIHWLRTIPCAGIIMGLMAGIVSSIAAFIVKLLPQVNPIQIVVVRSGIQLIFYLPFVLWKRESLFGSPGERILLFVRGFIGFLAFTLSYIAVRLIPLGDVATIVFSAPIYVSIFACICLSESCGIFQLITISMTITGTLLIAKPTFFFGQEEGTDGTVDSSVLRTEGTLMAFAASLLVSLTFIVMRKLRKTSTPLIISVFSFECVLFGSGILLLLDRTFKQEAGLLAHGIGVPDTWTECLLLFLCGACGVFALLCMTLAMKMEEAGLMSLVRSIDIVVAFMLQLTFLPEEVVHWTSILGAVIVVTSLSASALRRYLMDQEEGSCDRLWSLLTCGEKRRSRRVSQCQEEEEKVVVTVGNGIAKVRPVAEEEAEEEPLGKSSAIRTKDDEEDEEDGDVNENVILPVTA